VRGSVEYNRKDEHRERCEGIDPATTRHLGLP
jgi:hypothetical protein